MADDPLPTRVIVLRRIGLTISVGLLVLALFVVWRQRETVSDALAAMTSPQPWALAMLLMAIVVQVILAGGVFSLLMSRYGTVGRIEMQALIAATTLVNYLPLRPGTLGRVAYHKTVNHIDVTDSAKAVVQGALLSAAAAGYAALVAILAMRLGLNLWVGVALPVPLCILMSTRPPLRLWCWALVMRYVEVLLVAVRYFAAFHLLGLEISPSSAVAFACVSVIATMVPLVSNGLGLREWAIGLLAPLLTIHQLSLGITAELVNRAAELVVCVAVGLAGMGYLAHKRRTATSNA